MGREGAGPGRREEGGQFLKRTRSKTHVTCLHIPQLTLLPQSSVQGALCSPEGWGVVLTSSTHMLKAEGSSPAQGQDARTAITAPSPGTNGKFLSYILGLLILSRGASFSLSVKREASANAAPYLSIAPGSWVPNMRQRHSYQLEGLCSPGQLVPLHTSQACPALGELEQARWVLLTVNESSTDIGLAGEYAIILLLRAVLFKPSSWTDEPRAIQGARTHFLPRDGVQAQVITWAILSRFVLSQVLPHS